VTLTPLTVSAVLRRGGLVPAARTREGIHVAASGPDEAVVETDGETVQIVSDLIDKALSTVRGAGYPVRVSQAEEATFYVTRRP
jgi:hypothetical protein